MDATSEQLDALFCWPSTHTVPVVPGPLRQAGWNHESTREVLALLKDNHRRWHIFFNQKGFHKYVYTPQACGSFLRPHYSHATHHLLAIYAMGANPLLLKGAYETHVAYQRPAFPSPETEEHARAETKLVIDQSNWKEYLGDERSWRFKLYQRQSLTSFPDITKHM